jgi:hypothetical protein
MNSPEKNNPLFEPAKKELRSILTSQQGSFTEPRFLIGAGIDARHTLPDTPREVVLAAFEAVVIETPLSYYLKTRPLKQIWPRNELI